MKILENIIQTLPQNGIIEKISIGLRWTAVVININGKRSCGLSSTISAEHHHGKDFDVPQAGTLHQISSIELAKLSLSKHPTLASTGIAAINALLAPSISNYQNINAEEVIRENGQNRTISVIGHFPFVTKLREISTVHVIENKPIEGDLPPSSISEVVPQSDVLAITGMTFANHTFEKIISNKKPGATAVILGASTPLSPLLFEIGADYICGSIVKEIDPVVAVVEQGGCFPQIKKAGIEFAVLTNRS